MKLPEIGFDKLVTPQMRRLEKRIEALPYFDRTIPPHWKAA